MSCHHYKEELIDTAASGAMPQGQLRAHLARCPNCRAAFEQERYLLAAIDAGVHAAVITEVPPSLLPRVRAALDGMVIGPPRWSWFPLSSAAVAAALVIAFAFHHNGLAPWFARSPVDGRVMQQSTPSGPAPLAVTSGKKTASVAKSQMSVSRNSMPSAVLQSAPEILVQSDQEFLLASYAQQWSSRKRAPLMARDVNPAAVVLLEATPIQITELDVKLLTEGDSR